MDAKKCDRCGAYYLKNKRIAFDGVEYDVDGVVFTSNNNKSLVAYSHKDLCDDCIRDLFEFLKNKKSEV